MTSPYLVRNLNLFIRNDTIKNTLITLAKATGRRYLVSRIDTNNRCNLRCAMCPSAADGFNEPLKILDLNTFRKLAALTFKKTRILYLSCGFEPTLTPGFNEYLKIASEYHVPFVSFATNGQILKDDLIEAMIQYSTNEVIFSIDGATRETYEKIRKRAKFDRLLDNLNRLITAKEKAASKYPQVRFNYTVLEDNIDEIESFVDAFSKFEPSVIQYRICIDFPNMSGEFQMKGKTLKAIRDRIEKVRIKCKAKGILVISEANSYAPDVVPKDARVMATLDPKTAKRLEKHFIKCPVRKVCLYVRSNGGFVLCPTMEPFQTLDNRMDDIFLPAKHLLKTYSADNLCSTQCPIRPLE